MTSPTSASGFFAHYDSFGIRRAGSPGDLASADWLARELLSSSATTTFQEVGFQRFMPGDAHLAAPDGSLIEGLPLFDGGLTDPAGVTGRIGPLGSNCDIGFALMDPAMASLPGNAFARARSTSHHRAMVIALTTREGGLAPLNAHDHDQPFGPPVLQIAGRDAGRTSRLIEEAAKVRIVVTGQRTASHSRNLRAALPGQSPGLLLLTPRTSWWTSTAERAGGIWTWLQTLRALASSATRQRAVTGLATCGHELGHLGAHHAFAVEPALANETALVIHLGANLGAATDPALTVRSNVAGLAESMTTSLVRSGYPPQAITAVHGGKAGGEAHEIEQRGGRYLSLIGSNPWFHAPEDRWPATIDLGRAQIIADSVTSFALDHCTQVGHAS